MQFSPEAEPCADESGSGVDAADVVALLQDALLGAAACVDADGNLVRIAPPARMRAVALHGDAGACLHCSALAIAYAHIAA